MLGLQGNASSSKEYQCVACSATFTGLASLLVHQATHAGSLPKTSPNPPVSDLPEPSLTPSNEDCGPSLPNVPSMPMYICDCGDEFQDFSVMIEHKQSHVTKSPQLSINDDMTSEKEISNKQCDITAAQTNEAFGELSASEFSVDELPQFKNIEDKEEPAAVGTSTGSVSVLADAGQPLKKDQAIEDRVEESEGNEKDEPEAKQKFLMKILASAYGKHLAPPQSDDGDKILFSPKEEAEQFTIAPHTTKVPSAITDVSDMQLKRLLGKPGTKTKAPSISRLLESSTKKIVSLTKIFSPVVLLETRHKFMDPSSNNVYGRYQCARCRRVFQDVDSLTEHHFLHKKERIKCCRCCKQLIIGRVPLPDNHICPQSRAKTTATPYSFKSMAANGQKTMVTNNLNNRKKVYFCPICKHNYARRYNLKMHKCRGPAPSPPLQTMFVGQTAEARLNVHDEENHSQSIGVGTKSIKVEDTSDPEYEKELSNLSWSSTSSLKEQHKNASAFAASFLQDQDLSQSNASEKDEDGNQWTMPLNDMDLLTNKNIDESVSHSETRTVPIHYFIKDGVRRYPCNKCQQTFCSSCSLSRHKKLCCNSQKGLGIGDNTTPVIANNVKMYPCYVCGRNFNRKDNMMVHRKKCELRRTTIPNFASEINSSLPPSPSVHPSGAPKELPQEDDGDGGSWSIMSLPSVLPRRVTCECGIGFTSPKLLLEHLQKHAQESYTCPTCGVTVKSWADYEVHLQLHMHPQHHKQPQPLLLRFKQPASVQQSSQSVLPSNVPEKHPYRQEQMVHTRKKQQRTVCAKCGKSFASRCSLRRHISWNRCKALRMTVSNKTYHCSLCNSDFPNAISLLFHQRGGNCKPAIKPVRCPICLRWFTTTDGLQKHLLAHKNSETFRCEVCQGTYPSLKSLKIHRRRIHRILVRNVNPETNESAISV